MSKFTGHYKVSMVVLRDGALHTQIRERQMKWWKREWQVTVVQSENEGEGE